MKGIKKLGPGFYRVRVYWTDPKTGEQKERKQKCHGTREDALRVWQQFKAEVEAGGPRQRMTLTDYAQQWLKQRAPFLKASTRVKYVNDLERHILPRLGKYYLDRLRPSDVQAYVNEKGATMAGNSVLNQLRLLRAMSKDAMADGLVDLDFCARVKAPQVRVWTEEDPNCLTGDQLEQLERAIPRYWYALFTTIAFTGLRWGEVSGLHWDAVDFNVGKISVRWTNWKGILHPPKSAAGVRVVPMERDLAAILQQHRAQMVASQHPGLPSGLVFPTAKGTLHKGTPLNKVIKQSLVKAGIAVKLSQHGLRRTFNDLLRRVAAGMVVRSIVGHASEAMTDHYSRVDLAEKRRAQAEVLQLVRGVAKEPERESETGSLTGSEGEDGGLRVPKPS